MLHCETRQAQRFSSVPAALQPDLILLSGAYPLVDFTTWGKLINLLQIFVGVGLVAVPSGFIAGGFTELLQDKRQAKLQHRQHAAVALQRLFRGARARRLFRQMVMLEQEHEAKLQCARRQPWQRWQRTLLRFISADTQRGHMYTRLLAAIIAINCIAVILESEPSIGDSSNPVVQPLFDSIEDVSVAVFTLDFVARVWTAPINGYYKSVPAYLTSFFGIVDVASILPWYLEETLQGAGFAFDAGPFRVLRLFRLLQLERHVHAFTLLDDVWRGAEEVLKAAGLVTFVLWVGSATLFFLTEQHNKCDMMRDAFIDMPTSLYYTAMGGEWGYVDFTPLGGIVCCITCVLGIGLFAIPIGTVYEAFSGVLEEAAARPRAYAAPHGELPPLRRLSI
eukprot:TRINITY_DN4183_c0_g3_i1.p2 TRINITY_DN4183_c0_g3~~TRINITY_DN4183_c0_g3_i1.p2  ORF type:complete len:393 (-),score=112.45 TRINITY_DN4183_c0_g3_i1:550-1728(-)